jgi:hypothetical protein
MNQTPMTNAERQKALERLGYTEREAQFLCLAALHGGYFLRRQYNRFLGRRDGGAASQLIEKALAQGHARAYTYRYNTSVYHLYTRSFYEALGQGENRNRRKRQAFTIKNKLMGLDFVLAHPDRIYLATEQEKLTFFQGRQIPTSVLPAKVYRATESRSQTARYFVEKYPMFLSDAATKGGAPLVSFCFVDEGLATLSHFETFLTQYGPLFASLPGFAVIYVAAGAIHFTPAQAAFERFLLKDFGASTPQPIDPDYQRLLDYFAARQQFEAKRLDGFDRAKLIQLRKDREEFSEAKYGALYERWTASGPAAMLQNPAPEMGPKTGILGTFSTYLLEHNYDLFAGIAA